jgi:hypothetical protein
VALEALNKHSTTHPTNHHPLTPTTMPQPIKISIDLRLIDQSKCQKKNRRNGDPACFCDIVLWPTENDQYGNDYRVVQDLGKEARESGAKGAILGNGKNFGKQAQPQGERTGTQRSKPQRDPDLDSGPDIDF